MVAELAVFWAINGYFRLYASAGEGSLYKTTFIWVIPLMIVVMTVVAYFKGRE